MHKVHKQQGSAHVIVTVGLVVALLGTLGFIFYQNFIAKKTEATVSTGQTVGTSSQADTAQAATKTVSTKEYCTTIEKLCFDYPEDWSVSAVSEMGTLSDTVPTMDQVQIKNKSGKTYLYVSTGISGIGGTCDPSENVDVSILETHTTGIKGNYLNESMEQYHSSTAYAIKHVERTAIGSSQYSAGMHVLTSKDVINPGTVNNCSLGYGMISAKNQSGSIKFATSGFNTSSTMQTFSSYDEAIAFLNSDDAKTAYDILVSAHYN